MASESSKMGVITRFPPSPTGVLHVGSVRTALYNYLFAKQNKGQFILRIEDTDRERSKKEFEDNIYSGLAWLGLKHDNTNVVRQSERGSVYETYLKKMVENGSAYISKEESKEEGQRAEVVRFKNPSKVVTFSDLIRGDISFDTTELKDFIIAKSMTEPLYHLAVVVDDFEAGVTHIIRGEDGISNTPRQILLQEAIGAPRPLYAHLPLILDAQKAKLSKRKHGEKVSLDYYIKQGYFKEAIINYLALVGWNPGTEQEVLSLDELIEKFDISKVQKAGAVFNEEKLKWMNKQYLAKLGEGEYLSLAEKFVPESYRSNAAMLKKVLLASRERISVFAELTNMATAGEFEYFFNEPNYPKEKLLWKDEKDPAKTKAHLMKAIELLTTADPDSATGFTAAAVKAIIWPYAEGVGRGNILWPMRYALSGKDKSPDPFSLAEILGKDETIKRLEKACNVL